VRSTGVDVETASSASSEVASFTCTVPEPKPVEKPFVFELPDPEDQA
jgi:hypothetical protein